MSIWGGSMVTIKVRRRMKFRVFGVVGVVKKRTKMEKRKKRGGSTPVTLVVVMEKIPEAMMLPKQVVPVVVEARMDGKLVTMQTRGMIRLPTKEMTRLPTKEITKLPTKPMARLQTKQMTRLPTKPMARLQRNQMTRLPTKPMARLQTNQMTGLPTKPTARLQTNQMTRLPTKPMTRLPTKEMTRLPTKALTRRPPRTAMKKRAPSIALLAIPISQHHPHLSSMSLSRTRLSPLMIFASSPGFCNKTAKWCGTGSAGGSKTRLAEIFIQKCLRKRSQAKLKRKEVSSAEAEHVLDQSNYAHSLRQEPDMVCR